MNNDTKQSTQDSINRITLKNDLRSFLSGDEPDSATLDLLLEYPDIAKEWLTQAAKRIHDRNVISVDTELGRLSASMSGDSLYPGIHICIEQQDVDGTYERQLALAECTPDKPKDGSYTLRLLVWNDSESDDFTNEFIIIEGSNGNELG